MLCFIPGTVPVMLSLIVVVPSCSPLSCLSFPLVYFFVFSLFRRFFSVFFSANHEIVWGVVHVAYAAGLHIFVLIWSIFPFI